MEFAPQYLTLSELDNLRAFRGRDFHKSPTTFQGTLIELFRNHIEPNLPSVSEVESLHRVLIAYCREPKPVLVVRRVAGTKRGTMYQTIHSDKFIPSDNAPAWWTHYLLFNAIRFRQESVAAVMERTIPTHMFRIHARLPTTISAAGWHVAHIFNVNDGNVDYRSWTKDELIKRFLRNLHPCNCFYLPKNDWQHYGSDHHVISFFIQDYSCRYASVWNEFTKMVDAVTPRSCGEPGNLPYFF